VNIDPTLPKPNSTRSTASIAAYQKGYLAALEQGESATNPYHYDQLERYSVARALNKYWAEGYKLGLTLSLGGLAQKQKDLDPETAEVLNDELMNRIEPI